MNTSIRVAPKKQLADEWALVLTTENVASAVHRGSDGYELSVRDWDVERAVAILELYDSENPPPPPVVAEIHHPAALNAALAVMWGLLVFFLVTGERDPLIHWFERGSADAEQILSGEIWRTVTALTLHADPGHIFGNVFAGTVFLSFAGRTLGPGLAIALALAAGAGGNFINAAFHGTAHTSVGASTSVFGAVGLLGGTGVVRRGRIGARGHRRLTPIAAGLALLAMLGTGSRADLGAHLFGLLVGVGLGVIAALSLQQRPRDSVQWVLGAGALLAVLYAWGIALD